MFQGEAEGYPELSYLNNELNDHSFIDRRNIIILSNT
jgi:hypothetical protein